MRMHPLEIAVPMVQGASAESGSAVAATAVARRIGLPRRIVTILEGESLLNDATALTIYSIAIAVAVGGAIVAVSTLAVASSRIKIGGSFKSARAIESRCFSPTLNFTPRSPTTVS